VPFGRLNHGRHLSHYSGDAAQWAERLGLGE
jgi:hypothetical protein